MTDSEGAGAAPPAVPATPPATAPANAPAAPAKAASWKMPRWLSAIVGAVFLVIGLSRLYNVFYPSLPGCGADTTTGLIRKIFKEKNVELTSLGNFKTLTDTSAQKTCQADVVTAKETAVISYQITWQGSNVQVLITHVDAHPR
jgi:hypothetical protein